MLISSLSHFWLQLVSPDVAEFRETLEGLVAAGQQQ
jgi:hypothetical protein